MNTEVKEAIEEIEHRLYECAFNNIEYKQFCDGLLRAIEIIDIYKSEIKN